MGFGLGQLRRKGILRQIKISDTAPEHSFLSKFLDADNWGGNKNAWIPGRVRGGDFDACSLVVTLAAFEAKSATRNIFALNEAVFKARIADTRRRVHYDALMLASVLERRRHRARFGRNGVAGANTRGL